MFYSGLPIAPHTEVQKIVKYQCPKFSFQIQLTFLYLWDLFAVFDYYLFSLSKLSTCLDLMLRHFSSLPQSLIFPSWFYSACSVNVGFSFPVHCSHHSIYKNLPYSFK